jgi:hypothetical protein
LVYNLFSSCPAAAKRLRLLYTFLADKGCLSKQQQQQPRFNGPAYEASRHFEFNTDLKSLYVAVTWARRELLLYEDDEEVSQTLQDFLQLCRNGSSSSSSSSTGAAGSAAAAGLANVSPLDPKQLLVFAQESSKEEWSSVGAELFSEGKFERAEVRGV